mmetsp:Transcript_201/g.638  ORF Transcript_201/g.638 Transcript_201/m.638 type:complete len:778 (-) Transcript_201:184-2517(-)
MDEGRAAFVSVSSATSSFLGDATTAASSGKTCPAERSVVRTVPCMSYAKKNKKKKKLMARGLIKRPEDTRLIDLEVPETLEGDIAIVWFRKDLRVRDNEVLTLANTAANVIPVYVFDERDYGPDELSSFGFEKTSPYQAQFVKESVKNLQRNLRFRGAELVIRTGRPEQVIAKMCKEYLEIGRNVHVVAQKEVTKEETTVEFLLQRSLKRVSTGDVQAKLHLVWGSTLHHIQDLPYTAANFFPIAFATFKSRVDRKKKKGIVRDEIPAPGRIKPAPEPEPETGEFPSLAEDLKVSGMMQPAELDQTFPCPQACYSFEGGEDKGMWRIDDFIWKKDALFVYPEEKNSMGWADFSTKMSPYLAVGCISPRTLYWEAMKYQDIHPKKEQQGSFQVELQLQWRDFFKLTAIVYKNQLFARDGLGQRDKRGRLTSRTFAKKEPNDAQWELIRSWMEGRTGVPFIDAAMRELNNTGYMSNRSRQNVASYLMYDLQCPDWRIGAEYFQSKLIDYDVTSNWMNWQYVAGVSNDPKFGKRYAVLKQALTYDEMALFVRKWCPELALCPAPEIHVPFLLDDIEQEEYEIKMGESYPLPVVKPWRIPEEVDRPMEAPKSREARQRREPTLEEEVEQLVAEDPRGSVDGKQRFFVETADGEQEEEDEEEEEHVDEKDDFFAELESLEDDGTEQRGVLDEDEDEETKDAKARLENGAEADEDEDEDAYDEEVDEIVDEDEFDDEEFDGDEFDDLDEEDEEQDQDVDKGADAKSTRSPKDQKVKSSSAPFW